MQSPKRSSPSESSKPTIEPAAERKVNVVTVGELEDSTPVPTAITIKHRGTLIKFSCHDPISAVCAIFRMIERGQP